MAKKKARKKSGKKPTSRVKGEPRRQEEPRQRSVAEQMERELAAAALEKRRKGLKPTGSELSALKRLEKRRDEEARREHYQNCPQKDFKELAGGRHARQLIDFAARWQAPVDGATVDLGRFVRWVFSWFAENSRKLGRLGDETDDPMLYGGDSPNLERYRKVRADQEELKLEEMRGAYIDRDEFDKLFQRGQARLKGAVENLRRKYGLDAAQVIEEALRDAAKIVESDSPVNGHAAVHEP